MHAILGVAASDLADSDPTLLPLALTHRLKAVESIKRSLTDMDTPGSLTHDGVNALLATCLALTVQSAFLDDGLAEYMTFVRGMMVVGVQLWKGGFRPVFANLAGEGAQGVLEEHMVNLPLIRREWTDAAVGALEGLEGACQGPVEGEYRAHLLDWARTLYVSSWEGISPSPSPSLPQTQVLTATAYKALEKHHMWWALLPHPHFQALIDPHNQPMLLLAAHWLALQMTMAPVTVAHRRCRKKEPAEDGGIERGMLRWLAYLNGRVDGAHQGFNGWPVWVQAQLERDPWFFGKPRRGTGEVKPELAS